jgi:tRNA nucleotidyltransferase (CCA-adding enzyme)
VVKILENADALRRPQRFEQLLEACACDFHGRLGWEDKPIPDPDLFMRALVSARAVDAAGIARNCSVTTQIAERLHTARVAAVKQVLVLSD